MHPTLFHIGSFPVPSYGTMLAISFLSGILLSMRFARQRGLDPNVVSDAGLYLIISAIIGARAYYVMTHFHEFRGDLLSIVNPFQDGRVGISGLVMYGGFIAAIVTTALFFKIKKLPVLPYLDVFSPGVGVGIALTRVGCFLNGCCYGLAAGAGSFLSVNYPINVNSPAGYYQHRVVDAPGLLPTQFFESVGGIIIAVTLYLAGRSKFAFAGLQFYLLVVMYAVLRFFIETVRYIEVQKIGPFSHNQLICIVLFLVFGGIIIKKFRDGKTLKLNSKF
ncbi:MAG: prolipoprotein diacylglyceryl transferase [Chitinispirillales bacterium]|jgi:phosphatidylglycerol:prolipoprotein diacylglycerol transferase|nr:prolipoprotein diacylglyceryl transferase [Chitinispirillales bacterium]